MAEGRARERASEGVGDDGRRGGFERFPCRGKKRPKGADAESATETERSN